MNRLPQTFALASLVLLAATAESAAQSRVLFARSALNSDLTLRYANILRVDADGTDFRQLTPTVTGHFNVHGTWSPHGTWVAYAFGIAPATRFDIHVMTNTGAGKRRVTSGTGDYTRPLWRPDGGRIAFHANYETRDCVATVRPDGVDQRNVFCVNSPWFIQRAQWSLDSTRLYVAISARGTGLEPPNYSRAYRVNPATGTRVLLTSQVFEEERQLYFNPHGTGGVYGSWEEGTMHTVNFATDALMPLATGFDPVYSKSGTRLAFSRTQFGPGPDPARYANVFVINADGTGERQVSHTTANDVEYTVTEWSQLGTHLLVNRTQYAPSSPGSGTYVGTTRMRVLRIATGTGNWLPQGFATDWYQAP